jgi:hypothetical protein
VSVSAPHHLDALAQLTAGQEGLVARRQLTELGVGRPFVRLEMRARRWRRVHPGVYATFAGPLSELATVWAAVLYAGPIAAASHETAAWLHGLRADLPEQRDVCVPHGHRHRGSRGTIRVRQSRHLSARLHPSRAPARTTLEDTVLDLTDEARGPRAVIDLVLRVGQQRRTTPARLALAMRARKRLRWRMLLRDLVTEVRSGVQSPLERNYVHNVERPHGLPRGERNAVDNTASRRRYRDVRYRRFWLLVELDGRSAHPADERELDDLRDNEALERGDRTLRFGWRSVCESPCATAGQVARLLTSGGWTGSATPCGPDCTIETRGLDKGLPRENGPSPIRSSKRLAETSRKQIR